MSSLVGFVSFLLLSWRNQLSAFSLRAFLVTGSSDWLICHSPGLKCIRHSFTTFWSQCDLLTICFLSVCCWSISWALRFASPSCGAIGKLGTLPGSLASSGDEFGCWGQKWKTLEARRVVFVSSWLRGICPCLSWARNPGRDRSGSDGRWCGRSSQPVVSDRFFYVRLIIEGRLESRLSISCEISFVPVSTEISTFFRTVQRRERFMIAARRAAKARLCRFLQPAGRRPGLGADCTTLTL